MSNSTSNAGRDTFLRAILGEPDPAGAAAFAADILREDGRAGSRNDRGTPAADGSHEDWLDAVVYGIPARSTRLVDDILHEGGFNPNEPRDERGRWTTGGSGSTTPISAADSAGGTDQKGLNALVDKFKKTAKGKDLYEKAEKGAKANGKSLTIKSEPREVLGDDEGGMIPQDGRLGVRNDLSDAKTLETLIVELGNMASAKELDNLQTKSVMKMTRDEYIKAMEKVEFQSVQDTARIWKDVAKGFGQDPSECPSYGKTDDVLKRDFDTHFKNLTQEHKEKYGKQWDEANPGKK